MYTHVRIHQSMIYLILVILPSRVASFSPPSNSFLFAVREVCLHGPGSFGTIRTAIPGKAFHRSAWILHPCQTSPSNRWPACSALQDSTLTDRTGRRTRCWMKSNPTSPHITPCQPHIPPRQPHSALAVRCATVRPSCGTGEGRTSNICASHVLL